MLAQVTVFDTSRPHQMPRQKWKWVASRGTRQARDIAAGMLFNIIIITLEAVSIADDVLQI